MKAVIYSGAFKVSVADVPDPRIEDPQDAIIKITTANICGSDLHMYEGRTNVEQGKILGHENMGVVVEAGDAVKHFRPGDRVSVPSNVACGTCYNCTHGWTSFCLRTNPTPGVDGGAYGYASMGPYAGGQADYLRVPFADFNLLRLPEGSERERDFTLLSDIFPVAYFGTDLAGVGPGDSVAVFGAGPVGLLAVHSAYLRGAAEIFSVDMQPGRLAIAEQFGARAVNAAEGNPADQILEATHGVGVDCGVEAVGYQAHEPSGRERPELVMDWLVRSVRATGRLGVIGVYLPQDPGAATEEAKEGRIAFDFGRLFQKGQSLGTGQCPVKRYNERLRDEIIAGRAIPAKVISHELALTEAPDAYEKFDKRVDGYTKVILHPAA
jgi:glutathione-independent formaldehyde dehydrogenase